MIASSPSQYSPATLGAVLVGTFFASLIPDLDQPAAEIWDTLPFGHALGEAVDPFFKHRNISHSLLGIAIFALLVFWILSLFPSYWGIDVNMLLVCCVISYSSHLLADMFTVEGIPLFYPYHRMIGIPPKPLEGIRIMTGKWFENLVLFPAVNLWLLLTIILNWAKIKTIILK